MARKIVSLSVAILFFVNSVSFGLSIPSASQNPGAQDRMYAAAEAAAIAKLPPAIKNLVDILVDILGITEKTAKALREEAQGHVESELASIEVGDLGIKGGEEEVIIAEIVPMRDGTHRIVVDRGAMDAEREAVRFSLSMAEGQVGQQLIDRFKADFAAHTKVITRAGRRLMIYTIGPSESETRFGPKIRRYEDGHPKDLPDVTGTDEESEAKTQPAAKAAEIALTHKGLYVRSRVNSAFLQRHTQGEVLDKVMEFLDSCACDPNVILNALLRERQINFDDYIPGKEYYIYFEKKEEVIQFVIKRTHVSKFDIEVYPEIAAEGTIERIVVPVEAQTPASPASRQAAAGAERGKTAVTGIDGFAPHDATGEGLSANVAPTVDDARCIEEVAEFLARIARGEGPGSAKEEEQALGAEKTQAVLEAVNLLHNGKIEILMPVRYGERGLTDTMMGVMREVRKKHGDAINVRQYSGESHLAEMLSNVDRSTMTVVLTEESMKAEIAGLLNGTPLLFRGKRVANFKFPGNYGTMDENERTVYQADIITIGFLIGLLKNGTREAFFIRTLLMNMLENHMDKFEIPAFLDLLGEPDKENASPEEITAKIGYFLNKVIRLSDLAEMELRIMKLLWTFA